MRSKMRLESETSAFLASDGPAAAPGLAGLGLAASVGCTRSLNVGSSWPATSIRASRTAGQPAARPGPAGPRHRR